MKESAQYAITPIEFPQVMQAPDGRYFAFFPGVGVEVAYAVQFKGWHKIGGTLGREVATAFIHEFAGRSKLSHQALRGNLNKLRRFVEDRGISSLTELNDQDITAFQAFVASVESTRRSDWTAARRVIAHACAQAGLEAPQMVRSPWMTCPPEWVPPPSVPLVRGTMTGARATIAPLGDGTPNQHPRGRLAASPVAHVQHLVGAEVTALDTHPSVMQTADGFSVFFPARGRAEAHRQDLTDWWRFNQGIAQEVAAAAVALKRSNSVTSVNTWRTQVRNLLRYLQSLKSGSQLGSLADLTAERMLEFRIFIDKGDVATRGKVWRAAAGIVVHACKARARSVPLFPANPWPGHAARTVVGTAPLTVAAIGCILSSCVRAMDATMAESNDPNYAGVTLAELLPFVVVLTFWTLFNPETVTGIRCSGIRPGVLGRFSIAGHKGRSPVDQVATFPSNDDHPCAPARVIENVMTVTKPLRDRLPPDKRDFLFVGLVRQLQRAKAPVQAYADVSGGMTSYFRDEFCRRYGLDSFTIQSIRVTGAVVVNRLFGGDVKTAQVLLNHLSVTSADSYVRRDARRVEAERIADQMEKRHRFVRSGGLRDVRDQPAAPQSAATPGFVCSDPFDPPVWLDQEPGMCAAYGACPTCPLASVDRLSAVGFAHVLRLRNQIHNAHRDAQMVPQRWVEVWKPRLNAIEQRWLPMFSEGIRVEAAATVRDVAMPPLNVVGEL